MLKPADAFFNNEIMTQTSVEASKAVAHSEKDAFIVISTEVMVKCLFESGSCSLKKTIE